MSYLKTKSDKSISKAELYTCFGLKSGIKPAASTVVDIVRNTNDIKKMTFKSLSNRSKLSIEPSKRCYFKDLVSKLNEDRLV